MSSLAITGGPSMTESTPSSSMQHARTSSVSRSGLTTGGQPMVSSTCASAR